MDCEEDCAMTAPVKSEIELLKRYFEQTKPLPQLLSTVRSRRVGLGYSIEPGEEQIHPATGHRLLQERGPLAFVSKKSPVPLSELEEAILCWSACGPNGIILWDIAVHGGYHELTWLAGRTVASPGNSLATDLLFINDNGVFIYQPTKERNKPVEIESEADYTKILTWFRQGTKRILDHRPDISWNTRSGAAFLFGPYQYNINRPGSTWFIPIQDVGWLYFSVLVNLFDWWKLYFIDDATGQPAGLDRWVREGKLEMPIAISQYEQFLFQVEMYPVGHMVQNIRLACEAMGLGTWVFCGYFDDVLMGAMPELARGFQFRSEQNPKAPLQCGALKTFGLEGVKEGTYVPSPRYRNGEEVIRHMMHEKYSQGGVFSRDGSSYMLRSGGPYKREVAEQIINHPRNQIPDWAIEAAISYVNYCVEKYGQCPVYFNPMQCNYGATVHHVDEEFYQQYYVNGYVTPQIRDHMQQWH
jgi:hypothetical protein